MAKKESIFNINTDKLIDPKSPLIGQEDIQDLNIKLPPVGKPEVEQMFTPGLDIEVPGLFPGGKRSIYDVGITADYATQEGLQQVRHERQPWYASLGSAVNQAIVGDVLGGTIEGVGYLLDVEQYGDLINGTEKEFGNWFSDIGKSMRTWAQETTPIYTDPTKAGEFSPEDWTWWMSNLLPSVASTLSLMIPTGGVAKGVGMLGKALNLSGKLGKTAMWAASGLTSAIASRHMESLMEASQNMDQITKELTGKQIGKDAAYKIATNYNIQLAPTGFDDNGNATYTIDENTAKEIGAKSASDTYRNNWAMLIQDIPQYLMLGTPFGKATQKLTAGLARKLGADVAPVIFNKTKNIALDALGEFGEEAYQYAVGEYSRESALAKAGLIQERNLNEALSDYMSRGDLWTSAAFGALGAGFMQTAGKSLTNSAYRLFGIESDRDARLNDVDSWGKSMQQYKGLKLAAEQVGSQKLNDYADEFGLVNIGIKAAQHGNLDYLINAIDQVSDLSADEQNYLGIDPEDIAYAKEKNPQIIDDLKKIGDLYTKNINTHEPRIAELITREEINKDLISRGVNSTNDAYNTIINEIPFKNNLSTSGNTILEYEQIILPAQKAVLNELKRTKDDNRSELSKQLYNNRVKQLESSIEESNNIIADAKNSRTLDEVKSDNSLDHKSNELDSAKNIYKNKLYSELALDSTNESINLLKTKKIQNDLNKTFNEVQKENAKRAVNNAANPTQINDLKGQAKGTNLEGTINSVISNKANSEKQQQAQTSEEAISDNDFTNFVDNNVVSDNIINNIANKIANRKALSPRETAIYDSKANEIENKIKSIKPSIQVEEAEETAPAIQPEKGFTVEDAGPSVIKEVFEPRYNNNPSLFSEERTELLNTFNQIENPTEDELAFTAQFNLDVNDVTDLGIFFNDLANAHDEKLPVLNMFNTFLDFYAKKLSEDKAINQANSPIKSVNKNKPVVKVSTEKVTTGDTQEQIADIERHREEELDKRAKDIPVFYKEYTDVNGNELQAVTTKDGKENFYFKSGGESLGSKQDVIDAGLIEENAIPNKTYTAKKVGKGKLEDKINAKYDAELAQLKPSIPTSKVIPEKEQPLPQGLPYTSKLEQPLRDISIKLSGNRNYTAATNLNIVDKNGLANGNYKQGSTVYFEIDKTLESKSQSYENKNKDNPATRGIQIVVYKDGNKDNKSSSNRKVIGLLPVGTSNYFGKDVTPLRSYLHNEFNSKYDQEGKYITSDLNSVISGFRVRYSRQEQRNTPLRVLRSEEKSIDKFSELGGYMMGYSKYQGGSMSLVFPQTDHEGHSLPNTAYPGQIIIMSKDPVIGSDLLLRGFVRKLSTYESQNAKFKDNGKKIRDKIISILKSITPETNKNEMVNINNRINKSLISNIGIGRTKQGIMLDLDGLSVPLDDIQENKLSIVNKWMDNLIFNIPADQMNTIDTDFDWGFGRLSGPFNKIVNDFIELTTVPGKYYESVSPLIEVNAVSEKDLKKQQDATKTVSTKTNKILSEEKAEYSDNVIPDPEPTVEPKSALTQIKSSDKNTVKPSVTTKKIIAPFGDLTKGRLNSKIRNNSNKPKLKEVTNLKDYTKWNRKEELAWFKKNFPNVPISVLDNLKNIIGNGKEAWGAFVNASVYIAKNAGTGTTYHEAFHVVFNLYLNDLQRTNILRDANMSEEELADAFADYVLSEAEDKSLKKSINNFFRKLWLTIKSLFTNRITDVDELFFRANNGFYKNAQIDLGNYSNDILRTKIAEFPARFTAEAVQAINSHILMDILPAIRKSNASLSNKNNVELMSFISKEYGPLALWQQAASDMQDVVGDESIDVSIRYNIERILPYFFEEDGTPGNLIYESIRAFDRDNSIKIDVNDVKESIDSEQENITLEDNEGSLLENWQTTYTQRSKRVNAPQEVKDFLRYLPTGNTNSFGLDEYSDFDQTYSTLLSDLADATDINDMIDYLWDSISFHPEYNTIIERLQNDNTFASKFFLAFNNTHTKYSILTKIGDDYAVIDANRRGVVTKIITDWSNSVLVDGKVIKSTGIGEYKVDKDAASNIKDELQALKSKGLTDENITKLSNITADLGFKIDERVFRYMRDKKIAKKSLFGNKSLYTIVDRFANGQNPFDIEAGLESEMASIRELATIAKKATPEYFESAFRNIDGETTYAHLVPNFLTKMISDLKNPNKVDNVLRFYGQDSLYDKNQILRTIRNNKNNPSNLAEAIDIHVVNGLIEGSNRRSYSNMTKSDLQVMSLNSYYNNGNKTYSMYRGPVLADAPNMILIKFKRFDIDTAIDSLIDLAEAEYVRINDVNDVEQDKISDIKNYHVGGNNNTNTGYHIMPMFNGTNYNPGIERDKARKAIESYFNDKISNYKKDLINNKVILETNGRVNYKDSRIHTGISKKGDFNDFLKEFYLNDYLIRSSFSLLTVGDPAFYKAEKGSNNRMIDYTKRAKEIYSPKFIPDVTASYTDPETGEVINAGASYNSVYLKDNVIPSPSLDELSKALDRAKNSGYITDGQRISILASYKEVNQTDAQAYTTLPFYRRTMVSFGRWTDRHQKAYKRLIKGHGTSGDIALVMQPIKPFSYSLLYDDNIKRLIPVQHKNSEYLLLPQLVKNNPTLKTLHDFMIKENVGVANFESAVKAGLSKRTTVDNLSKEYLHEMNMADRGLQMEVPEHFVDADNIFGTQIRKLIIGDLIEGVDYTIGKDGEKAISKRAQDLKKLYEDIILADLKEGLESAENEFLDDNKKLNWKKIHDILLDEARSRGKGESFESAIQYDEVNNRLKLPLFDPSSSQVSQNLLTSVFKSRITKQKINGGSFVQATNFGLSRELKLVFENDINNEYQFEVSSPSFNYETGEGEVYKLIYKGELDESIPLNDRSKKVQDYYHSLLKMRERMIKEVNELEGTLNNEGNIDVANSSSTIYIKRMGLKSISEYKKYELDKISREKSNESLMDQAENTIPLYEEAKKITELSLNDDGSIQGSLGGVGIEISPQLRGKGLGKDAYRAINQYLNIKKNISLKSDPLGHSEAAHRVWESLRKSGEAKIIKGKKDDFNDGFYSAQYEFVRKDLVEKMVGGLQYAEVMLPAWSKQFYQDFVNSDGTIDFEQVEKSAPELLEMIGYRIPTEDKYSMLPLKVVGFLPLEAGGAIMLPAEITTISGSDFDVDKMYVMIKNHERSLVDFSKITNDIKASQQKFYSFKKEFNITKDELSKDLQNFINTGNIDLGEWGNNIDKNILLKNAKKNLNKSANNLFNKLKKNYNNSKKSFEESISSRKKQLLITRNDVEITLQSYYSGKIKIDPTITNKEQAIIEFYEQNKSKYGEIVQYDVVKYDYNKSAEDQSKEARDNAKIDIIKGVLQNQSTLGSIMTPGGFDYLKDLANLFKEKLGQSGQKLDIYDAQDQDVMAVRNTTGKALVGPSINHNMHHTIRQGADMSFTNAFLFDNESLSMLGKIKANTQFEVVKTDGKLTLKKVKDPNKLITKNYAEIQAAIVDNAKDPVSEALGYNIENVDLVSAIISVGYDSATGFAFASQPIIKYIKNELDNDQTKSEYQIMHELAKKFDIDLRRDDVKNINTQEMIDALGSDDITTDLQKRVLLAYNTHSRQARDLAKLIRVSRADSVPLGPTIANGEILLEGIDDLLNNADTFSISNVSNFLSSSDTSSNIPYGFTEYGYRRPISDVLNKAFPYSNDFFKEIKRIINENQKDRDLSDKQRNNINNHIVSYMLSGFDFFDFENKENIIFNFPLELFKVIKRNPDLANNKLLKVIKFEAASKKIPIHRLIFSNTGALTETAKQDIQNDWLDLLNSDKKINKKIGEYLIKYAYFTTGFNFTPNSFNHLIPTEALTDIIKDETGYNTYSDYLYNIIDEGTPDWINNFTDQFYKNMYGNRQYVPRVDEKFSNVSKVLRQGKTITGFIVNDDIANDTFVIKRGTKKNPIRFIAHELDNKINLYKFVEKVSNGDSYDYKYELTNKLGLTNYVYEYALDSNAETLFTDNNIKTYSKISNSASKAMNERTDSDSNLDAVNKRINDINNLPDCV